LSKDLSPRRQARELALQVLFQTEFLDAINIEESLNFFKGVLDANNETYQYAQELCSSVVANRNQLDEIIQQSSDNWKISRMALVDLNILRIATYEIRLSNGSVPPKSSIDEAVDLAKKYSTTDSSGFINGILDRVLKNT
tara:strand:+ start:35126 stop:35545 length:420 start_codon:yes stop_codon:yes gene_type:complete